MLLPLLQELPRGRAGVDTLSRAVVVSTLGVAYCIYAVLGVCGAGIYGTDTPGDIMAREFGGLGQGRAGARWQGGGAPKLHAPPPPPLAERLLPGWGQGLLGLLVALYLAASIPALGITMRYTLARYVCMRARASEGAGSTRETAAFDPPPPPTHTSTHLRHPLCSLIVGTRRDGETLPTTRRQDVGLAALTLAPALAVALALPGSGE